MASLPQLAFAFARFVARRTHPHPVATRRRWNSGRRRWNSGRCRWNSGRRRPDRNGGLRHRRAPYGFHHPRYGPGGDFRLHHRSNRLVSRNNCHGNRWTERRHSAGDPGPSMAVRREHIPFMHPVAAAEPVVVDVPEIAEEVVVAENEIEASASHVTADPEDLMPPPPAFVVPPMEWLLGGPSAGWIVDDPEREYSDDELETPPPMMRYFERHGNRPRLSSPTPPDEVAEHFRPPGYADITEFFQPPVAVAADAPPTALPDLNIPAQEVEEEKNEDAAPSPAVPTPSPEARVLLRRFASAMAVRPGGIRRGTWSPEALGLTNGVAELRLNEAAPHLPPSSVEKPGRR